MQAKLREKPSRADILCLHDVNRSDGVIEKS